MKEIKIYTCGKMSGISFDEQMSWRRFLQSEVEKRYDGMNRITFIHPPLFYNYENKLHKSEREILDWEMKQVHDCDIVVVDLHDIETTVGSHMELGEIQGINRFGDKYIFIIGIGSEHGLHPWIKESCHRIEFDCYDAAKYIVEYLLI